MSRGNSGEVIYCTDEDRRRFLGLVSVLPARLGTQVHAFVLLDSHYNLASSAEFVGPSSIDSHGTSMASIRYSVKEPASVRPVVAAGGGQAFR